MNIQKQDSTIQQEYSVPEPRVIWTAQQEMKLQELQKQKESALEQNRIPLLNYLKTNFVLPCENIEDVADYFIIQAQTLRYLLEPFDSEFQESKVAPRNFNK